MNKISIIGAGRVGSALARNWRRSGHEIQFAVRDPGAAKYAALASLGTLISLSEAAPSINYICGSLIWIGKGFDRWFLRFILVMAITGKAPSSP